MVVKQIRNCPKCNSSNITIKCDEHFCKIICENCGIQTKSFSIDVEAITDWNNQVLRDKIEKLKKTTEKIKSNIFKYDNYNPYHAIEKLCGEINEVTTNS